LKNIWVEKQVVYIRENFDPENIIRKSEEISDNLNNVKSLISDLRVTIEEIQYNIDDIEEEIDEIADIISNFY